LQERVETTEARMEEMIERRVVQAHSKQSSQQAPATSGPNDEMSPSNKHKSSIASTEAPTAPSKVAGPGLSPQRSYPVDEITGRSACEIYTK